LHSSELLYLFELYRINKIGDTASPYVNIEWPGIQIPLSITTLLHDKILNFPFLNDNNEWDQHDVNSYERNSARRGLDFADTEDTKKDFLRYAVYYHSQNPIANTRKHPLPPLEKLVEGTMLQLAASLKVGCVPRKDICRALREACNTNEWFPNNRGPCRQDLRVNTHLGAGGAMTPGRIQNPKGGNNLVVSYKTATRVATAISRKLFKMRRSPDPKTSKLTLDKKAIVGWKRIPSAQRRRIILVYKTSMHTDS
jgi:hypothetical protein